LNPANPDIWDDGRKGNYWSDYLSRYPNASEVGDTGVGNTPFFINENNVDLFPLMEPVTIPNVSLEPATEPTVPETDGTALPNHQDENLVGTGMSFENAFTIASTVVVAGVVAASIALLRRNKKSKMKA
jgi:hypothetical protein